MHAKQQKETPRTWETRALNATWGRINLNDHFSAGQLRSNWTQPPGKNTGDHQSKANYFTAEKSREMQFWFLYMNALLILFAHELTINSQHREMLRRTMKNSTLYIINGFLIEQANWLLVYKLLTQNSANFPAKFFVYILYIAIASVETN